MDPHFRWTRKWGAAQVTATYAGDLIIKGKRKARLLDRIAWYGGNCGVDYELTKGHDISSWREKQYTSKIGGTHPVCAKAPNRWGLYDMLGNVWEWCLDEYRDDLGAVRRTPSASTDRLIRGGAWSSDARHVRAAYRRWRVPDTRNGHIGFRCGEFRVAELSED
jgi:formylglycine-generating enzyme required for sulfatase activity